MVRSKAKELRDAIRQLDSQSRRLLTARARTDTSPFNELGFEDFDVLVEQRLDQLLRAIEGALSDIPKSPSGPRGNPALTQLVRSLASIFTNETGGRFSRTYKLGGREFVMVVVAKAEPQATRSQIDEAMKVAVRASRSSVR
jgi:hypothetical protein